MLNVYKNHNHNLIGVKKLDSFLNCLKNALLKACNEYCDIFPETFTKLSCNRVIILA